MKNIFIGILVLIFGIATGLMIDKTTLLSNLRIPYLSVTPTPLASPKPTAGAGDPTAGWKTYTNTKYSYLFKYPTSFSVGTKGNIDASTADGIIITDGCKYDAGDRCITGILDANKLIYDASKKLSDYFEYAPNQAPNIISEQSLTISENPALAREIFDNNYYYSSSEHGMVRYTVVVVNNQTVFHFDFIEEGKDQKSIQSMKDWQKKTNIDQILSTFKFINQPTVTPTSGFVCPPNGYVDCMPIMTPEKQAACSAEAMAWYKANCPNFKGGAL